MSINIPYIYLGQSGFTIQGLEGDQAVVASNSTIKNIYDKYISLFCTTGGSEGIYTKALGSILSQLKTLFEQSDAITIENIDGLLKESQKINGQSIESVCREGYMALRYYLQTIIDKAKTLNTYIQQAQVALSALESLSGTSEQINDKAHELITTLQICDNFSYEISQDFKRYYQFDNDTKLWNEKFKSIEEESIVYKAFSEAVLSKGIVSVEGNNKGDITLQSNPYIDTTIEWKYYSGTSAFSTDYWINKKDSNYSSLKASTTVYYQIQNVTKNFGQTGTTSPYTTNNYLYIEKGKYYKKENNGTFVEDVNGCYVSAVYNALGTGVKEADVYFKLRQVEPLRKLQIPYHDSNVSGEYPTSAIQIFSSLTLMDRLRYIRYYYQLIIQYGATDYSVFPDDTEMGFPCIPNEVAKEGEDQKSRGGMELFYLGYLIDRDGPINAISSFLEVKTQALRANLQLSSTQISSLNIYLEFVNKGLELLNSRKSGRIADGVATVAIGILGSNMYNTFKDNNGVECLVIPTLPAISDSNPSQFYLIKADEAGMEYFITGNTGAGPYWHINTSSPGSLAPQSVNTPEGSVQATTVTKDAQNVPYYYCSNHNAARSQISGTFKLPTKLNVQAISPLSIKGFIGEGSSWFNNPSTDDISSWTDAFTNKTKYINTAIDTINTDVQVDRNKIDSLDSMCSTFRSRAHDTYSNVASNIR